MVGDEVEVGGGQTVLRGESDEDGMTVFVEEDLTDDGVGDAADFGGGETGAGEVADEALKPVVLGADEILDEVIEGWGGIDHFAGHDAAVVTGHAFFGDAGEEGVDEGAKLEGGRREGRADWRGGGRRGGFVEDGGVEGFLVAEVIADGGEIGAGDAADVADGGVVKAPAGEDAGGGDEELAAGIGGGGIGSGPWRLAHERGELQTVV